MLLCSEFTFQNSNNDNHVYVAPGHVAPGATCRKIMRSVRALGPLLAPLLLSTAVAAFTCDDGRILPDDQVNDDYCDCGTDEPQTGACPNTLFKCACAPHRPVEIFASRVNDGVCDCCDGTDEFKTPGACPNTCVTLAAAELVQRSRAALNRAQRESLGAAAAAERTAKLAAARSALDASAPAMEAALAKKTAAEAAEVERKADRERRLAAGEVAHALKMGDLPAELLHVALARLAIAMHVPGADALHDKLSASSTLRDAMDDVDSADLIEVAMEAKDASQAYESDGPASDGAEKATQACAEAPEACGFEGELLKLLPLASMPIEELREFVRGFAEEHGQVALLARVSAALLRGAGVSLDEGAVAGALELLEPFKDEAADAARAAHAALEAASAGHRTTLEQLGPVEAMAADFGASHEWHALHGNCYSARLGSFDYKLCPFGLFSQDGKHSLGKYEGWVPREAAADAAEEGRVHGMEMAFGNGDSCPDGTPRKARVAFECGEEDALLAVDEPSTCVYSATFRTPSACTTDATRKLHGELAAAASAAGLPYEPDEAVKTLLGL